jgi:tocopherol cyclase
MLLHKLFHPEVFQGSLKKSNYFEGWYIKNVSSDLEHAIAFIPGISLSEEDPHAFIQFVDGINRITAYFRYPLESFVFDKKKFRIKVGDSFFSDEQISIDLSNNEFNIKGTLNFSGHKRFPKSITMPGIMGWYSYIPAMECNHAVVSVHHDITGIVTINGTEKNFTNGSGYIEKDWGVSFPESWIWLQCNNFETRGTSLMLSVAKIPWRGHYFIGLISVLSIDGKTEVFASYNNSVIESLKQINKNLVEIKIRKGRKTLSIKAAKSGSALVVAPVNGKMSARIKESINSEVEYIYTDENGSTLMGKGQRAGYEEMEKIFTYFR